MGRGLKVSKYRLHRDPLKMDECIRPDPRNMDLSFINVRSVERWVEDSSVRQISISVQLIFVVFDGHRPFLGSVLNAYMCASLQSDGRTQR